MRRRQWWLIVALVLGAWLRFHYIAKQSFWFDEGYTAWIINHPAHEIIRLDRADTAPPLYYLLLHFWSLAFGRSETALRSLSAVAGTAAIALVFAIARRLLVRRAAVIAAVGLFVCSFMQIWYSQEARGYELMAFLTALMLYALLRHLERPNWKWLMLLIAAGAAGMYVHNLMALYIIAIAAAGFVFDSPTPLRRRLRDAAVAGFFLALLYLPWLPSLSAQMRFIHGRFWSDPPTLFVVEQAMAQLCGLIVHQPSQWHRQLVMAVILIFVTICVLSKRNNRRGMYALAIVAVLPPLAAAILSHVSQPIFVLPAFLPSTIAFPILIAAVFAENRAGALVAVVLIGLCIRATISHAWATRKEDWRTAAAIVEAMPQVPHRLIVFVASEGQLPFDYYYHLRPGEVETGAPGEFFDLDPPRTMRRVLSDDDLDSLRRTIASGHFDDVVLIVTHGGWIDKQGRPRLEFGFADPQARTARYVLSTMRVLSRTDLPDDPYAHDIAIWRCAPAKAGR